ncbi:helix-turn-helix domain-containing protein [Parvibaculum sedimenti]|uniref:DNA-3-methyladenine glycosylase II n=1 Tax=Parvibaculum sedimenti TaxID=2608632 RepID=A0A6N6VLL0_9HYPH|nr:DNA-3-methyladenine glycosylase 2 [Parvibaculum sedimenti]KAB7742668.1 helix-turn-helix domain-containing protein [Parvibaculum sedimenti]
MTIETLDPDFYYRVISAKDARFDGRFFTCVTSTGIYCRPICPARTPKRENCRFVASAAAAEALGFRSCLRCRPETAPGTPAWAGTQASVARALRLIEDSALDEDGIEALAARVGLGARQLRRLFLAHVGATPQTFAANRRLLTAKQLITETNMSFADIAFAAGYQSLRRFNDAVRASYGVAPTALRRDKSAELASRPGSAITLRLGYRPPFDWERLLSYLSIRAIPGIEEIGATEYRRSFRLADASGVVTAVPSAKPNALDIHIMGEGRLPVRQIATRIRRIFDLDADPLAIAACLRDDALLGPRLAQAVGMRVPGAFDGFELGVRAILGQQVSVKGATTLTGRVVARTGEPLSRGDGKLTHYFPTPEALARADLSGLGLTGGRIATLKAFAKAVARGDVSFDPAQTLDEKIAELCAVPGIGEWTAHYIALRAIGEPDAFPASDLGLRKAAGNISTRALMDMAEGWRPWRGYAALLLWMVPVIETQALAAD